jgi:ureidoacrylate peracid hydrolase
VRKGLHIIEPMITIEARPESVALDARRAAVLVIDMQNDFGSVGGMFERAGIDISGIRKAAVATQPVLQAARAAGIPVIYVKMGHAPDLSDAGSVDSPHWIKHIRSRLGATVTAPDGSDSRILVRDTWNTEILDELTPEPGDLVVAKHRYSAFFETELDDLLKSLDVTHLIVTGCTTSICVESTVRDAMFRDYSCIVLEDCTAEPIGAGKDLSCHESTLLVIETLFGWISSAAAVIDALARQAQPA